MADDEIRALLAEADVWKNDYALVRKLAAALGRVAAERDRALDEVRQLEAALLRAGQ